jgi:uncharacterized membrane protein
MIPPPPDMWRIELLHPPLVHFPIAFLLLGTALEIGALVRAAERRPALRATARLLFVVGAIGAWLAVWSGGEAEHVVNRVICDPTVTEEHETWGLAVAWIFSGVALATIVRTRLVAQRLLTILIALAAIAGSLALTYTGHLGATLVYQQGAGVYRPTPTCAEFADEPTPIP